MDALITLKGRTRGDAPRHMITTQEPMFATQHGILENIRIQMVAVANQALANLSDLHSQAKQAH